MTTGTTTGMTMMGRAAAVSAIGVGVVYLGWRAIDTLDGTPWWLGGPTLAIELVGLVAVAVTCWALWRRPEQAAPSVARIDHRDHRDHRDQPDQPGQPGRSAAGFLDVEIVVRCSGQSLPALRASLLAARPISSVVVLDIDARPEVAAVAVEHGARYVATDPDDVDGLAMAALVVESAAFLLLEAGDVPHPGILDSLVPWLDEPTVAIVQGAVEAGLAESAEHGSGGRHDKQFERRALVPALGARGLGAFTGSGALLRTAAVRGVTLVRSCPETVQADLTGALFVAGWQIAAPGGRPVAAVVPIGLPADVEVVRAREASAARHLLVGDHGAFRPNRLSIAQRIALMALAVRPLAGLRRGMIVALLVGALSAGRLPVEADPIVFAALWTPWFVLAAVALWCLSGGELRPGDRVRWSMRVLGASWRGVAAPDGRPDPAEHVLGSAFGLHHGVASAAAIGAISIVIALRALSDRVTHTLAAMPLDHTAVLLVVALWSLGGGLDALRILARRAQARRATRVASSLPSTFADHAALVVDLTPLGAGVLGEVELPLGTTQRLDLVLPTASGVVSATLPVVVRNVRIDFSGERRYGVEFTTVDGFVSDALAEYCMVQPALDLLGADTIAPAGARTGRHETVDAHPVVVFDDHPTGPRRMGLRAAALVAVTGAMASAVPTAQAADPVGRVLGEVRVSIVDEVAVADPVVPPASTVPATVPAPPDTADLPALPDEGDAPGPTAPAPIDVPAPPSGANEGSGAAGTVVTVVCSLEIGADRSWGTSDDVYGAPVSTVVAADGTWSLDVDGAACWATIAPPVGLMVPGETSSLESPRAPRPIDLADGSLPTIELVPSTARTGTSNAAGAAGDGATGDGAVDGVDTGTTGGDVSDVVVVDDVVWADLDADGVIGDGERRIAGVRVHLLDDAGTAIGSTVTDDEGVFRFDGVAGLTYRLAVSNLPDGFVPPDVLGRTAPFVLGIGTDVHLAIGLLPTSGGSTADGALGASGGVRPAGDDTIGAAGAIGADDRTDAGEVSARLFVAPPPGSLLGAAGDGSPLGSWIVVMLATLIGVSVLAGSLRPGRSSIGSGARLA